VLHVRRSLSLLLRHDTIRRQRDKDECQQLCTFVCCMLVELIMGFLAHLPQLVLDIRWMRSNAAILSQSAMLLLASSRRGPDQMLHSPLTTAAAAAAQWVNSNDTCDTKLLSSGLKKRRRLSSLLLLLDVMHATGRCNVLYIRSIPLKVVQELMTSVYILRTHTSQGCCCFQSC